MKIFSKIKINSKLNNPKGEIQLDLYVKKLVQHVISLDTENDLNSKIIKTTITIKEQYPELSNHIKEMSMLIPDEKNTEKILKILKKYHDSLHSKLNEYILKHADSKLKQ